MEKKENSTNVRFYAQTAVLLVLAGILIYSVFSTGDSLTGGIVSSASASDIIPSGVPKIYGKELNIRYDDVSPENPSKADETIRVLARIDQSESLSGEELQRYIKIASEISCEYCCGAESIIFDNGRPACGCAHSYAMRGLAKYLIKFHGEEFSDLEILEELGKWKVLFFPGIHESKAEVLKSKGIEVNYINLASNRYRGIERGQATGGMVGGC